MAGLQKSTGSTPSERSLASLCERTFLAMWSYPNLFRDQRLHRQSSGGKELCDVLAVCGSDILIFSDKSCEIPNTGDVHTDWIRWYKRSIERSVKQVYGAERWIQSHPSRVFTDEKCTEPFPLLANTPPGGWRFTRIVVARNIADRCSQQWGGVGTLIIDPDIQDAAHIMRTHPAHQPFAVGDVCTTKGFIHVFDELSVELVLREFDTVTDLMAYLNERERAIRSKSLFSAHGEEDLAAVYIAHTREDGTRFIPARDPEGSRVAIEPGAWFQLQDRPEYKRRREADEVSYVWDRLIQDIGQHVLAGNLEESTHTEIVDHERALRIMALESRFARRVLADGIFEKLKRTKTDAIGVRIMHSPRDRHLAYVFVLYPLDDSERYEEYRKKRRAFVTDYCFVLAWRDRSFEQIIAISTESGVDLKGRSHDLVYMEPPRWTPDLEATAREIQQGRQIQLSDSLIETPVHYDEYPPE